jgi:hypothetical protein
MITMVIIAAVALMLTFTLMRGTARSARRGGREGIRWRGIDWSAADRPEDPEEPPPPPQGPDEPT